MVKLFFLKLYLLIPDATYYMFQIAVCNTGEVCLNENLILFWKGTKMRTTLLTTVIISLAFTSFCPAAQYQVIDLGEPWSFFGKVWFLYNINDSGQVAGTEPSGLMNLNAFIWEDGSKYYITAGDSRESWANNISNSSILVGAESDGFTAIPFYWQGGATTYLGTLHGKTYTEALAVNEAGEIVGYMAEAMTPWLSTAVLWKDNEIIVLGKLNSGDQYNMATDINSHGQIVGFSGESNDKRAFLWQSGSMQDLGTLPGDISAVAEAINEQGQVVGYSLSANGEKHAFLWQNDVMTPLAADGESWAVAVNDNGQAVGTNETSLGTCALLWENGQTIDLNSQLSGDEGWTLTEAHDINNSEWIVGVGVNPEGRENSGFLLVPVKQDTISADVEIKPETLNLKSKGLWLTCHLCLPEGYDVSDIDISSILMNGQIEATKAAIDEEEQVLIAKFLHSEIAAIINPGEVTLTVTGRLVDSTEFEGEDTIRVIDRGRKK